MRVCLLKQPFGATNQGIEKMSKADDFKWWMSERTGHPHQLKVALEVVLEHEARIAELENQWISVEDRLPDAGQWYLCWSRNQTQIIFLDTVEPIMWLQDGDYLENVTHWMNLPAPPKETQR